MTTLTNPPTAAESRTMLLVRYLLVAVFLVAGGGKLLGLEGPREMFAEYGYSQGFRVVIGVLEVAGALGLLVPALIAWAALGLCGIMVGAIVTHLLYDPWYQALVPLVVLVLLLRIVWLQPLCARLRGQGSAEGRAGEDPAAPNRHATSP